MAESDLERFKRQANMVTDDSLQSTRRMVEMVEESQQAGKLSVKRETEVLILRSSGAKTLEMLETQGEQLDRIEKGLDTVNADMKEAEKHITQMEKWCGLCLMPWNRRKKIKDVDDSKWEVSKSKDGQVTTRQPPGGGAGAAGGSGPYIQRESVTYEATTNV